MSEMCYYLGVLTHLRRRVLRVDSQNVPYPPLLCPSRTWIMSICSGMPRREELQHHFANLCKRLDSGPFHRFTHTKTKARGLKTRFLYTYSVQRMLFSRHCVQLASIADVEALGGRAMHCSSRLPSTRYHT